MIYFSHKFLFVDQMISFLTLAWKHGGRIFSGTLLSDNFEVYTGAWGQEREDGIIGFRA